MHGGFCLAAMCRWLHYLQHILPVGVGCQLSYVRGAFPGVVEGWPSSCGGLSSLVVEGWPSLVVAVGSKCVAGSPLVAVAAF